MSFVHLKTSSEYSITQSINTISGIVNKTKDSNSPAVALTDLNGMFGTIDFYRAARKQGIKPIIGINATIEQEDGNKYQLTLLAKNNNGYKSLIKLNSKGYVENRTNTTVAIKEEWLTDLHDVVVLSGGKSGLVGQFILDGKPEDALIVAKNMQDYFGEDFYIELERDGTPEETTYMDGAINICQNLGIAPVATHNNYFLEEEDFLAHEARFCISQKQSLYDLKRERLFNKDMYLKSTEEMQDLFADIPQALNNTVLIAQKCNPLLELNKPHLPDFQTPNGETADDYFATLARNGLTERMEENFPDPVVRNQKLPEYQDRLEHEIKTIQNMGFPGYFLIVADFINWAKENDIPVGPGRGSGAGSLVAYSMHITDLDPLPYNLLFERFLNPDRVSMPDFDIDFCQSRRNEVYEYVRRKYGQDAVSQIGTFGTMAARSVIRDVGRTLDYPHNFVDNIAKSININPAKPIKLQDYIFGNESKNISADPKLLEMYNNERDVKRLIDIAVKIEGLTRQVGTHAAGVVISPTTITDFSPLYTIDNGSAPTTQFEKDNVETAGLVKFDFLGLRNLTIIKEAVDLVNESKKEKGEPLFDLRKISLEDEQVYANIFAPGNTTSIFQFEGKGMTNVLQKAKPSRLEDLTAITSLYRPGPMDIIPDWLIAKNQPTEQLRYPDPKLKDILGETYGFFVYQEQVMQCAQLIAGYTLGQADLLRRAMGKKMPAEMAQQRSIFMEGAKKNGVNERSATEIFNLMEKFAEYGFNKSHAAAYSLLSFQTAYLKNYYPEEFFVATLNSQLDDTNKLSVLSEDAIRNNIKILPPDINSSEYKFKKENENEVRYGLGALKGVGEKAIQAISKSRNKDGPFIDFYDFMERVGGGQVNKRVIESLIRAGALDNLHNNRAQLFDNVREALDYVSKFKKRKLEDTPVLPNDLFDNPEPVVKKRVTRKNQAELIRPQLNTEIIEWSELDKLKNEKLSIGFFFSSNPYFMYKNALGGLKPTIPLIELEDYVSKHSDQDLFVSGLIEEVKVWNSKKGAFVTINDGSSPIKLMVYADFLEANKEWFKEDAFASFRAKVLDGFGDGEEIILSAQQAFNLQQTRDIMINTIYIGVENNLEELEAFEAIVKDKESKNKNDVSIVLCTNNTTSTRRNQQVKKIQVDYTPALFDSLVSRFGEKWVVPKYVETFDKINFPDLIQKGNYNRPQKKQTRRRAFSN